MRNRRHERSRFFHPRFALTTILRPGRTFGFLNLAAGAALALVLACGPDEERPTGATKNSGDTIRNSSRNSIQVSLDNARL